jgi:hypothetical protein
MADMSHEPAKMVGRSAIADSLVLDCLRRGVGDAEVPMILLLGRRGSGKTSLLAYVRERLASSDEMPYALVDCAERQQSTVWRLICDVADGLNKMNERWCGFGRLEFPRTKLGRLAAEHGPLPPDDQEAKRRLLSALREAAKLSQRAMTVDQILINVINIMRAPLGVGGLAGQAVRMVARSEAVVKRAYGPALKYFGDRGQDSGDGLANLITLNRRFHAHHPRAEYVLCRALLDDLIDEFSRRSHKFNCTVLLDNCEGQCVVDFLNLLTELRRPIDPLLVIAASRSVPKITNLDSQWSLPWESATPALPHIPDTEGVDYVKWKEKRRAEKIPVCWWYPVWLRDLTSAELNDLVDYRHVGFIHRLTHGHPWGAQQLARVLPVADVVRSFDGTKLHDLLLGEAPAYLLEGLEAVRPTLVKWSAAQTIETAMRALDHDGHPDLYEELVRRLWLVPGRRRHEFQLHPWLRRVLLHELAGSAGWENAHRELRRYCDEHERPTEAAYHSLALNDAYPAVSYLLSTFHKIDADHWIQEFDGITSAPKFLVPWQTAEERYETMMRERDGDVLANVIFSMVAARSIWFDPLGDPTYSLRDTIADGYARLADMATAGFLRYRGEARYYRDLDPQKHTFWSHRV